MTDLNKSVDNLRTQLGFKALSTSWAKVEILGGLLITGIGLMFMLTWIVPHPVAENDWTFLGGGLGLFVFGSYLAMVGNRSHLYQSSNKVTAYLVEEIRRLKDKG